MSALMPVPGLILSVADIAEPDTARAIDAYVLAHAGGTPFHRPAWSLAIAKGCGQQSHYLVARDGAGEIGGIVPLTAVRSRLFGNALASAGFAVDGGVLADSDSIAAQLSNKALDLARALDCSTVELRGGMLPLQGWKRDDETYLGFAWDLATTDEEQLTRISRKQRANVRKALDVAHVVTTGSSAKDRAAHFACYAESVRNLGTPVFPRSLFDAVLDAFGDDADILTVWHEGRAIASVLTLYHKGCAYPYWGGGPAVARNLYANDRMYYELMLHARRAKGCTRFDFGRSKAGTGPAAYKKTWGFEPQPLAYAKCATDGGDIRDINPLSPKYRMQVAVWKKLPLWLANTMGPIISKGLG